jgi:integrase family protein with SAM-like domain
MGELIRHDSEGWERLRALVLDSVPSPHSKRAYRYGLDAFLLWYRAGFRPPISKAVVSAYKAQLETLGLSASTINVRLSAIRKLVAEAADNGLISAEVAASVAKVKGAPRRGVRMGNWLDREQAERLLQSARLLHEGRQARSGALGRPDRLRIASLRGGSPHFRTHPRTRGAVGYRRSDRQTRAGSFHSNAWLGQSCHRPMEYCRWNPDRPCIPAYQQGGTTDP